MNASLKPKWNIAMLMLWAIAAALSARSASSIPWVSLASGALLGGVAGMIQARILVASKSAFIAATSLLEVRKVLEASTSGKTYFMLFWGSQILLLLLAIWLYQPDAVWAFAASYCAYAFARELATLPATFLLSRASDDA
jgi:hypothetical protein